MTRSFQIRKVFPLHQRAVLIQLRQGINDSNFLQVSALLEILQNEFEGKVVCHPAYDSILVESEEDLDSNELLLFIQNSSFDGITAQSGIKKTMELPICYHRDFALDADDLERKLNIPFDAIRDLHLISVYRVDMMGFLPGFPFLSGLDPRIAVPRKKEPRKQVPKGSVGIGGQQTGIYPQASPGGWNILGRCPIPLFTPNADKCPFLLERGQLVKFKEVSLEEYKLISSKYDNTLETPKGTTCIKVLTSFPGATIQDLGGHSANGVPRRGALDWSSMVEGNRLVGNKASAPSIELFSCQLELEAINSFELSCAGFGQLFINKAESAWDTIHRVKAGDLIKVTPSTDGQLAYLCISGGVRMSDMLFDSYSTCISGGFGGSDGRYLSRDMVGYFAEMDKDKITHTFDDNNKGDDVIRVYRGPEHRLFTGVELLQGQLKIGKGSNRMGYRLISEKAIRHRHSMISSPVIPGTIQLPPSGQPIVIMKDGQTIGGYPRIGQIHPDDLNILAQRNVNKNVQFKWIEL